MPHRTPLFFLAFLAGCGRTEHAGLAVPIIDTIAGPRASRSSSIIRAFATPRSIN